MATAIHPRAKAGRDSDECQVLSRFDGSHQAYARRCFGKMRVAGYFAAADVGPRILALASPYGPSNSGISVPERRRGITVNRRSN